jgi:ribosomal protein S18 acetylase RimI-like enzyme
MNKITITFSQKFDECLENQIYKGFQQHGIEQTGSDGNISSYVFVARLEDEVVGIVSGKLFWGSLRVKNLFVFPQFRGQGVGTKLLEKALEFGRDNNCPFVVLETFNFQALDFYKKLGFEVEFARHGYDGGSTFYYLRKDL